MDSIVARYIMNLLRRVFALSLAINMTIALLGLALLNIRLGHTANIESKCNFYNPCVLAHENMLDISSWGVVILYVGAAGAMTSLACLMVTLLNPYSGEARTG